MDTHLPSQSSLEFHQFSGYQSQEQLADLQKSVGESLNAAELSDAVLAITPAFGELSLSVAAKDIVAVLTCLRDAPSCAFSCFIDLCGVDYPARFDDAGQGARFDVVYHLLSPKHNRRIRVKISASETVPVPSVISVYPAADWYEREAYDLYGILFSGHPDLRRILTDYGFEGHPLRKDFPTTGFVEVRYDDAQKRVLYEPVRLAQDYRQFDFLSPWEGELLPPAQNIGDEKASVASEPAKGATP